MSSKKADENRAPREFWIDFKFGPDEFTSQTCLVSMNQCSLLPKLIHVREVMPDEASHAEKLANEVSLLRKQLEVAVEALQGITLPSHTKYSNSDTEFHNRLAYKTLDEIERIGRGE